MSLESAAEFAGVQRPRACLLPRCGLFRKDDDSPVRWNGVGQSCFWRFGAAIWTLVLTTTGSLGSAAAVAAGEIGGGAACPVVVPSCGAGGTVVHKAEAAAATRRRQAPMPACLMSVTSD